MSEACGGLQGLEALTARFWRQICYANRRPDRVLFLKKEKPYWGARKICELMVMKLSRGRRDSGEQHRTFGARPLWPCAKGPQ